MTLADAQEEALRIIKEAQRRDIPLRLFGGLAVRVHSPSAAHRALQRAYPDIDFVTTTQAGRRLTDLLTSLGYTPDKTFNTLSGDRRQLFYDPERERQVDVFIGTFEMCHKLPIDERLEVEPLTIPLAEILLSKMQIVQMNEKDMRDVCALLLDHEVGEGDEETINAARIADLCRRDWGLYKTVSLSLRKVEDFLDAYALTDEEKKLILARLQALRTHIEEAPKSLKWRIRAGVGEKVQWYDLPEEVQRG